MLREAFVHLKKRVLKTDRSYDPIRDRKRSVHCLAKALSDGSRCTLLSFYSPKCDLCSSMSASIDQAGVAGGEDWLDVVRLNIDDPAWIPEVSYYSVDFVPCLVLLDKKGRARYKSVVPRSRPIIMESFKKLLDRGRFL